MNPLLVIDDVGTPFLERAALLLRAVPGVAAAGCIWETRDGTVEVHASGMDEGEVRQLFTSRVRRRGPHVLGRHTLPDGAGGTCRIVLLLRGLRSPPPAALEVTDALALRLHVEATLREGVLDRSALAALVRAVEAPGTPALRPPALPPLSPRRLQVLERVARGLTNREIASDLGITEGTVELHVSALFEAFAVKRRVSLAAAFWRARG